MHADWLRFPIVWAETGQLGTLLLRPEEWQGLAYSYYAAGAPDGEPSSNTWVYAWNGRFFEPRTRIEPHQPTVVGSLAWSVWWAWLPSAYVAVIVHALTVGTAPITDGQFLAVFLPAMCGFWAFAHWVR